MDAATKDKVLALVTRYGELLVNAERDITFAEYPDYIPRHIDHAASDREEAARLYEEIKVLVRAD